MPTFQKAVNPLTVAQQQPAIIFSDIAKGISKRLRALEGYPTPISAANENAPAQKKSFISRLLTPVRNAFNDINVYDVPEEVRAKSISLEHFPFVKITADLEDTTGKIHERTLWLQTDKNTWRHLRDAPTVVNTIERIKKKEKLAFFSKGSSAATTMFTAVNGKEESITPINISGQKAKLNDLLQNLQITIQNPGYRRGNQDNEARLFADDSKYLQASITYTGLISSRPESKDYYPGQLPPVDRLGTEIANRFGGLLSEKTNRLLMYRGRVPFPPLTLYS